MLYSRMIIIMFVSLYTSRILLQALGVTDLGVYSIIAGIIILFGFIQNVTTLATQRFLSIGLGKEDLDWTNKAFNTSIIVHLAIAIIILLIGESVGLWFVKNKLSIPTARINDVSWVFQFSLVALIIQIIQTPYIAAIIACEKMEVYAKIGIIDAFQRWFIVFLLSSIEFDDKLKTYPVLVLLGYICVFLCYFFFSIKKFYICKLNFKVNKNILYEMFSFSSWTLAGSLSVVALSQCIAILINIFFGVIANASLGLSDQVLAAINRVTGNFQTAFNPQIIKSYASGNIVYLKKLIVQSSKLSFGLVLMAVVPIYVDTHYILSIWLGTVPEYLVLLVKVVTLYVLIDCLSGPFVTVIYAVGKLKRYQLTISIIILSNLVLAFILVLFKLPLFMIVMARVSSVAALLAYRLWVVGELIRFNVKDFLLNVIFRLSCVAVFSILIAEILNKFFPQDVFGFIYLLVMSSGTIIALFYFIALTIEDKIFFKEKAVLFYSKLFR